MRPVWKLWLARSAVKTGQLLIGSRFAFAAAMLLTLRFPGLQHVDLRLPVSAVLAGTAGGAAFSMLSSLRDRTRSDLECVF